MVTSGNNNMGRFSVEVELVNNDDLVQARHGQISPEQVRRLKASGVVDTGATRLVIPEEIADRLGLQREGRTAVRYADGRRGERDLAGGVRLKYAGRSSVFNAIIEPARDALLIGAIVLEDLDLLPDCTRQTLTPRDPKQIISEIE